MKKLKIFLLIILILIIIFSVLCIWQKENLKSVYYSAKYDDNKIDELITEHKQEVETYLKEHGNLNVRPSTPVEEKLHQSGVITDNELVEILTGKTDVKTLVGTEVKLDEKKKFVDESGNSLNVEDLKQAKQNRNPSSVADHGKPQPQNDSVSENGKNIVGQTDTGKAEKNDKSNNANYSDKKKPGSEQGDKPIADGNVSGESGNKTSPEGTNSVGTQSEDQTENKKDDSASNKTASDYIAQLYVLKSSYISQIDGVISSAYTAYSQMSDEEKKNAKSSLMDYYNTAVGLEQQCDAAVEDVISQLTAKLTATGGDLTIVDKVISAYSSEKSLIKAQYLNKIR